MSTHAPFQNLDDPSVLQHSLHLSSQPSTQNFILEFGDSHAHIAFDVSASLLENLLSSERPDAMCTRWINLWSPFPQREILEGLARGYDFSPRLLALMGSDPRRVESERGVSAYARAAGHERSFALSDLESRGGSSSGSGNGSAASSLQSRLESLEQTEFGMGRGNAARTGNLYDIVDEVWHYSSLDQGRSYLCLGYNSLYPIGNISPSTSPSRSSRSRSRSRLGSEEDRVEREKRTERGKREERATTGLPNVKRIWTWLLLLSDRTVVTITEDPYPNLPPSALSPAQRQITNLIRRNTTNILRSLSTLPDTPDRSLTPYHPTSQSPLHLLPLRNRLGRTAPESAHRTTDAPGLLFYYIFEDWENSYALVTRRESYYSSQLLALRTRMFEKPELAHVRDLERIGKELGVLKRWFEAYLRLVDGVVEPMAVSAASLAGSFVEKEGAVGGDRRGGRGRGTSGGSGGSGRSGGFAVSTTRTTQVVNTDLARDISSPVENSVATVLQAPQGVLLNTESLLGVSISSAARVRFERLKDMITLYALSECEDCLRQKEELVQMVCIFVPINPLCFDSPCLATTHLVLTYLDSTYLIASQLETKKLTQPPYRTSNS